MFSAASRRATVLGDEQRVVERVRQPLCHDAKFGTRAPFRHGDHLPGPAEEAVREAKLGGLDPVGDARSCPHD